MVPAAGGANQPECSAAESLDEANVPAEEIQWPNSGETEIYDTHISKTY